MTFNEIKNKANNFKGKDINITDKTKINKNIIEILKLSIKNNIKFELDEKDFAEIINIYYDLYHIYYDDFLKKVLEQSRTKIDLSQVLNILIN